MTSQWQAQQNALDRAKCTTCKGLGKCDDAQLGDIMFNTWDCTACKGTGFADVATAPAMPPSEIPTELVRG